MQHAHILARLLLQIGNQLFRAGKRAGQGIAHPDGHFRRGLFALFHHIEMVIEGGHLINFRHGNAHVAAQGGHVGGGKMAVFVLDQMQIFDQKIALNLAPAQ